MRLRDGELQGVDGCARLTCNTLRQQGSMFGKVRRPALCRHRTMHDSAPCSNDQRAIRNAIAPLAATSRIPSKAMAFGTSPPE